MLECFDKHFDIEIAYKFLLFYKKNQQPTHSEEIVPL